jgi:hypothetical protein
VDRTGIVNHVPDDALAAIDDFGEGILHGDPRPADARLRSDLRVRVAVTDESLRAGEATVAFLLDHSRSAPTVRDHGSFVATVVDGIDGRLVEWGVDPPPAYEYDGDEDGWRRYAGTARF